MQAEANKLKRKMDQAMVSTLSTQVSQKQSKKRHISELGEELEDAAFASVGSSKRHMVVETTGSKDLSKSVCIMITLESTQATAELDSLNLADKKPS
jgi:hypothetical protein